MTAIRSLIVTAAIILTVGAGNADAQPVHGKFRGGYVCERLPTTRGILRTPLDLIIDGTNAWFAGSEMASGTIDENGQLRLTSRWTYLGSTAKAEYSGTVTRSGGTLIGAQIWTRPGTPPLRRACVLAVVPAPNES